MKHLPIQDGMKPLADQRQQELKHLVQQGEVKHQVSCKVKRPLVEHRVQLQVQEHGKRHPAIYQLEVLRQEVPPLVVQHLQFKVCTEIYF